MSDIIETLKEKYYEKVNDGTFTGNERQDYMAEMGLESNDFEYSYLFESITYPDFIFDNKSEDESMAIVYKTAVLKTLDEVYGIGPNHTFNMVDKTIVDYEKEPEILDKEYTLILQFNNNVVMDNGIMNNLVDGTTKCFENNDSEWRYYAIWQPEYRRIVMTKALSNKSQVIDNWSSILL